MKIVTIVCYQIVLLIFTESINVEQMPKNGNFVMGLIERFSDPNSTLPSIHVVSHSIVNALTLAPRPTDYDVNTKNQLLSLLTSLLGCEVAAHYLLLSLVSKT